MRYQYIDIVFFFIFINVVFNGSNFEEMWYKLSLQIFVVQTCAH